MANDQAWAEGLQIGGEMAEHRRARREQLEDQDRQRKALDLHDKKANILQRLYGRKKGDAGWDEDNKALVDTQQEFDQLWSPVHAPGALRRNFDFLTGLINRNKQAPIAPTVPREQSVTVGSQTIPLHPAIGYENPFSVDASVGSPPAKGQLAPQRLHRSQTPGQEALGDISMPSGKISVPTSSQPAVASYQSLTPYQRKLYDQRQTAEKEARELVSSQPSPESKGRGEVAEQEAKVEAYMENWHKHHPGATEKEEQEQRDFISEGVAGFKSAQGTKWIYKNMKVNGKLTAVKYNEKDPRGTMLNAADNQPIPEGADVRLDTGKIPPGLSFYKPTGQVKDGATGRLYSRGDPNIPPDIKEAVDAMFAGYDAQTAATQAYNIRLTQERGKAYNMSKAMDVWDAADHTYKYVSFSDAMASPGRYTPHTDAAKGMMQVNMMEDIARSSRATRASIIALPEFDEAMQAKMASALAADDHGTAFSMLLNSNLLGTLTKEQQQFLINTRQLSEQAMAMRSILGAGQGSDDVRRKIQETLPGLLSPNPEYALMQLNAFDAVLEQLHRAVPDMKLGPANWTVQGGENQGATEPPSAWPTAPPTQGAPPAPVRPGGSGQAATAPTKPGEMSDDDFLKKVK